MQRSSHLRAPVRRQIEIFRSILLALIVSAPLTAQASPREASHATFAPPVTVVQPVRRAAAKVADVATDPLAGLYRNKPVFQQCAAQPVVGPMPTPQGGSLESQPLYQWSLDPELVDSCRKPF